MASYGWIRRLLPARRPRRRRPLYGCRRTERLECKTLLSAFVVTTPIDLPDVAIGDGFAVAANGETSLRAAVQEANARPGPDMIIFPARHFALFGDVSVESAVDEAPLSESLAVTDDLMVIGWGATPSMVEGILHSRVFDVQEGVTLNIGALILRNTRSVAAAASSGGQAEIADVRVESDTDAPPTSEPDDAPRDASSETAVADLNADRARAAVVSAVIEHQDRLLADLYNRQPPVAGEPQLIIPRQIDTPQVDPPLDVTLGITNPRPAGAEAALEHDGQNSPRFARSTDGKTDTQERTAGRLPTTVVNSLFEAGPGAVDDEIRPAGATESAGFDGLDVAPERNADGTEPAVEGPQPLFPELEIPPVETELPVIPEAAPFLPDLESDLPEIQVDEAATSQRRSTFLPVFLGGLLTSAVRYRSTAIRQRELQDGRPDTRWATRVEALI
jgi:hypothetical protein